MVNHVNAVCSGFDSLQTHTKLKLMKRHELKMFIEKQFEQYGVFDWYKQPADCTNILYFIENNILDKVEELYVQH